MNGNGDALGFDLLGFYIDGPTQRTGTSGVRIAFADDMRGENDGTAVGQYEKARVDGRARPDLDEKRSEERPSGHGETFREPGATANEPQGGEDERGDGDDPPKRRAPGASPGPEAERESDSGIKERVAGISGMAQWLEVNVPESKLAESNLGISNLVEYIEPRYIERAKRKGWEA